MKRGLVWSGVILTAAALDLGVRFSLSLQFASVLWIEVVIFLATALVLFRLYRVDQASPGWRRGLQAVLVASFALGALRSAIWASGRPVTQANAVVLGLCVAGWFLWRHRRRRASAGTLESEDISPVPVEDAARET